ncbi:MAG: hypothetical protein HUU55_11355 [Myxococcales bacterium]|nr:hypothetical protein [Myxococcales bacterium]
MHRLFSSFLTAAFIAVSVPTSSLATVVLQVGIDEMTHTSQVILHATVESVETVTLPDRPGAVFTDVTFVGLEALKGSALLVNNRLTVRVIGGKTENYEVRIPGMPLFRSGEEVVVFLEKTEDSFAFCGLGQGVFRVETDGLTGEKVVTRNTGGLGFATFDHQGRFEMSDAPRPLRNLPLAMLLEEIRIYVDRENTATPVAPVDAPKAQLPKLVPLP